VRPIALVGSLSIDRVGGAPPHVGGMPYWASRALRTLGTPASVLTRCAASDRTSFLRPVLALGLPVSWCESTTTTAFSFHYEDERRVMTVDAIGDPWRRDDVRGVRAEWVHVGPLLRSDFPADTLAELTRGRRLSLDGQGLVRVSEVGPLRLDDAFDPEVLRHVHVLKLAEEEAHALVGEITEGALASLDVPEVVVTYGPRGSSVFANGVLTHVPAHGIDAEPTGAGDSFCAAYVASRAVGHRPEAAARRATALVAAVLGP
jgi:sugar/nucleoside kinase (ribokinase family)